MGCQNKTTEVDNMRDAILGKLGALLGGTPDSEAEVVYVLIETRKFLEHEGTGKKSSFATLKFFCDWVAHVKLSFSGAKKVLSRLDAEIGASGPFVPETLQPESEIYRLMSLEPLKEEMNEFCRDNHLPEQWTTNPIMWRDCTRFYGNVVMDCPLDITRGAAAPRYIKQLTLTNAVNLDEPPQKRSFSWDWRFDLSDGYNFTLPCRYTYPPSSYDPSVPSTAEFGF
jgi:hypothetical protein